MADAGDQLDIDRVRLACGDLTVDCVGIRHMAQQMSIGHQRLKKLLMTDGSSSWNAHIVDLGEQGGPARSELVTNTSSAAAGYSVHRGRGT